MEGRLSIEAAISCSPYNTGRPNDMALNDRAPNEFIILAVHILAHRQIFDSVCFS